MDKRIKEFMQTTLIVTALVGAGATNTYAGWEKSGDNWRYSYEVSAPNPSGSITQAYKTGNFIDPISGNVYYFDENGFMIANQSIGYRHYGEDGKQVNFAKLNDTYTQLSESYIAGNKLEFKDEDSLLNWVRIYDDYYNDNYYEPVMVEALSDGTYQVQISKPGANTNEKVENFIKSLSANIKTGTIEDTVKNVEIAVSEKLQYEWDSDKDGFNCGLEYAASTGKAQDYQYVKYTNRVLKELGIDSEIIEGDANNGTEIGHHAWLRVNLNQGTSNAEHWMYCDPTWYDATEENEYLNIDYDDYLATYSMDGLRR
jgi:hypothetical protein